MIVLSLFAVSMADSPADLRSQIDSTLQQKQPIRDQRQTFLDQLHIFSDNREIKKTDLDQKEKHLLYAYRDYFVKEAQCDGLDYERSLLDGAGDVTSLGDCLPPPLHDSAKGCQQAQFENDALEGVIEKTENFRDEQSNFLSQWSR